MKYMTRARSHQLLAGRFVPIKGMLADDLTDQRRSTAAVSSSNLQETGGCWSWQIRLPCMEEKTAESKPHRRRDFARKRGLSATINSNSAPVE